MGWWPLVLLLVFLACAFSQETGEECLAKFKKGREDFVLDVDESVKDGAMFISSPKLDRSRDCVAACCKEEKCNVAFMQGGAEENSIKSCFLFNCLYKKKYACRFVRKKGYYNYILDSVYESYLEVDLPPMANGGQDRVVQPQDSVTLNGLESKDDEGIVSYLWQMLTKYPYAVIEVRQC
uniref:MANSC domain-containing protein n=1 Tax=Hippocampus comes TaxID=109280 RepID=A0A3Q2Y9K2_HIPCM